MPVTSRERPYDLAARGPGVARAHSLKCPDWTISLGMSVGVRLTSTVADRRLVGLSVNAREAPVLTGPSGT
jgi:hypothetical protein